MDEFKAAARAEWEKLCALPPRARPGYIWDYYKLWIIGTAALLLFAGTMLWHAVTTPGQTWFFACIANVADDLGEGSAFYNGFVEYAGYDTKAGLVQLEDDIYCHPAGESTVGSTYYEQLIAYLDAGTLDVLVMGTDDLLAVAESGRLMRLDDERAAALLDKYPGRILTIEADPDGSGQLTAVPVGIDLAGSVLEKYYGSGCALGISAHAPHTDQVSVFLEYLFTE